MAASSAPPSGTESTGLPAITTSALIWPSPGVDISSARLTAGNSPITSGWPLTRLKKRPRLPGPELPATSTAGLENITPPSRSRLPVAMLSRLINQCASVPNGAVLTPMRP